ncbi:MAG TPA: HD domain-containing protein, partial [Gammaproteobacteria bacterium]|nr:HD domain-containing protein [Gammaproteobacteria bacterium]
YQLHIALRFESDLKATLIDMDIHPWVLQKLTVLKQCLPQWFEKAVFGAWLAGLVVREMSLGQPMIDAALIAGWTHDVGFLRIDPAVLFKKGRLEPEEWRVLQSHVITGQRFLLAVPDLDPQVPSAVREHHERCDGTGYPDGRTCRQLGLLGKVIGMADSVLAIRVNQFKGTGRTLRDVLPYLQMNDVTHSLEVYRAMSSILKKSNLKPVHINPYGGIRAMAEVVHRRSTAIHEVRKHLILFQRALLEQARGSRPCKVANVLMMSINNVLTKTAAAGLEGDETLSWLAGIQDGEDDVLPDLNELELAENELLWHIQSLLRAADNYFDSEAGGGGGIAKMKNIAAGVRDALAQAKAAGRK